jgi:hypothetical protein
VQGYQRRRPSLALLGAGRLPSAVVAYLVAAGRRPDRSSHLVLGQGPPGRLMVMAKPRESAEKEATICLVALQVLGRLVHPPVELSRRAWVARSTHPGQMARQAVQAVAVQMQERLVGRPVSVRRVSPEGPLVELRLAVGQQGEAVLLATMLSATTTLLCFPRFCPSRSMAAPQA